MRKSNNYFDLIAERGMSIGEAIQESRNEPMHCNVRNLIKQRVRAPNLLYFKVALKNITDLGCTNIIFVDLQSQKFGTRMG